MMETNRSGDEFKVLVTDLKSRLSHQHHKLTSGSKLPKHPRQFLTRKDVTVKLKHLETENMTQLITCTGDRR